jgi:Tfp pilus assembly protein PilX
MIRTFRSQEGSALITAMLVMMLCLMIGFTLMSTVDVQQSQSRGERERESSFALGEGALNAQIFMLSTKWPASVADARPRCTQATGLDGKCPDPSTLAKGFSGADYNEGLEWSTEIHDNVATGAGSAPDQFYNDATVRTRPGYDSNGDGLMWVRAQSFSAGRRRTMVALIRAERLDTLFPRNVITANRLSVSNNGNKTMVVTNGSYLILRCGNGAGGQLPAASCQDWGRAVHVGPNATVNVEPNQRSALSPETIERMREFAKANGTYHESGCPSLTGEIVFLQSADCSYTGNSEWNTATKPGVLIIGSGTLSLSGNTTYNGVVYHINGSDGIGPAINGMVLTLQGNGCVFGSVVVDGAGGLQVGSSSGASKCDGNVGFNANAANNLRAYGTAGIVQNSFREIVAKD